MTSIITNTAASVAVQSLNATSAALSQTEKQISTGYRVADATDDGAAYAIAQNVRSDVGALTSANQQLGNVKGLISTTITALNNVTNTLQSARDVLVKLADSNTQGNQRTQYIAQYKDLASQVQSFIKDASYSGRTLIGNITGGAAFSGYASVNVVRNEAAATYHIAATSGSAFYGSIYNTTISSALSSASQVAQFIGSTAVQAGTPIGGEFLRAVNAVGNSLNTYGSASNYVDNQSSYNSNKIDALNNGLGALVDADLTKESALLQSLQTRQQLATQALTIANQTPQTLLSLFK